MHKDMIDSSLIRLFLYANTLNFSITLKEDKSIVLIKDGIYVAGGSDYSELIKDLADFTFKNSNLGDSK